MNNSVTNAYPVVGWTWQDGKGGLLRTQIFSDGHIWQERQCVDAELISPQNLGTLTASDAAMLLSNCRAALKTAPASPAPVAGDETYELMVADSAEQTTARKVARANLNTDVVLNSIRQQILGARKKVYHKWNIWVSAGARWFFLMTAVTIALALYIGLDMKHDNALQARAQKMTATVVERGGVSFKNEHLKVQLDGASAVPPLQIYKYLSHPHWEAAKLGSQVDVLYDAQSKQVWLTSDLLRWQSDKKTIWVIPAFLLLTAFIGLAWLRRYQIGAHADGDEYLIREDRVVGDDKDARISRSTILWFKMFI